MKLSFWKNTFTFLALAGILSLTLIVGGCSRNKASASNEVVIGTIDGPETQLMQVAQQEALKNYGLKIKIVTFSDYNLPNEALNDGSLDANMFQHLPYLEAAIKAKGYKIVPIGKTFIYPMGLYSQKYKTLTTVPDGATVAIPDDPSNQARALLLLQNAGLLTLKAGVGTNATVYDVISNPHQFKLKTLAAAQLPRVLPDVGLAAINTNYAVPAGLYPSRDALYRETPDSPYANLVVVRIADQNDPKYQQLMKALHSQAVLTAAGKLFQGQAIPAWPTHAAQPAG